MQKLGENYQSVSVSILEYANLETTISDFLDKITGILLGFAGCDLLGIYIYDNLLHCYGEATSAAGKPFIFETVTAVNGKENSLDSIITKLNNSIANNEDVILGRVNPQSVLLIEGDGFKIRKVQNFSSQHEGTVGGIETHLADRDREFRSRILIPIMVAEKVIGLLSMQSRQEEFFAAGDVENYKKISDTLGIALLNFRTQAAHRERVKELSCLYGIAQIAAEPGYTLDDVMRNVVGLLPPAWQYPEITEGRIIMDGHIYSTPGYMENLQSQTADICINGNKRGFIEVAFTEIMPELDEGPFLREERNLIDAIARLIAQIIERKQAEDDRIKLQEQLRHADRLATIGQLAAGVAHEFNEPLGNVLGFAQLILRNENLPDDIKKDIDKIVTASMHAREVIRKLMLFARQMPAEKSKVDLNKVIEEGLYFLDARCSKAGIEMVRSLTPDLPEIMADQSQMQQVLVNLVVNAIQAMPDGGTITISTECLDKDICLRVTDTGAGMSEEIQEQLFIPFFTTKDVDEGTGLGLPVVHGIVTSHGGSIEVSSKVGIGSSFEIQFPIAGPDEVEVTE